LAINDKYWKNKNHFLKLKRFCGYAFFFGSIVIFFFSKSLLKDMSKKE